MDTKAAQIHTFAHTFLHTKAARIQRYEDTKIHMRDFFSPLLCYGCYSSAAFAFVVVAVAVVVAHT